MMRASALCSRLAFALALCSAATACERAPTTRQLTLTITGHSDSGAAVADVRAWLDGRDLGATDAKGRLETQLQPPIGAVLTLTVACPPEFRTRTEERTLRTAGLRDGSSLALSVECQPRTRTAVLVVIAQGDGVLGLPVRVDGRSVGQLDELGIAHVRLDLPPHSSLRVELDTGEHHDLTPADPVQTFRIADEDAILLFEQTFSTQRSRPGRRVRKGEPRRKPPYKIM